MNKGNLFVIERMPSDRTNRQSRKGRQEKTRGILAFLGDLGGLVF
jgi:hypothetical protein